MSLPSPPQAQPWDSGSAKMASHPHRVPNLRPLSQSTLGSAEKGETLEYLLYAHLVPRAGTVTSNFRHHLIHTPVP